MFFEPITISSPQVKEFLWDVSWEMQTMKVRWCQIQAVGRVWNNFKFGALYCHWSGNTSAWCSIIMLKKHLFFCMTDMTDLFFFFFQILHSFHVSLRADSYPFYSICLSHFCLLKLWDAVTGPPECGWSFRFKFLSLSLKFITQWWTVLMLTVPSTQKANNCWWILVGVVFLWIKKSVTACCLVCNTKVENELSVLNRLQRKPLGYHAVPHCKLKPTEQWTSWS